MSVLFYQFYSFLLKLSNKLKFSNKRKEEYFKIIILILFYFIPFIPPKWGLIQHKRLYPVTMDFFRWSWNFWFPQVRISKQVLIYISTFLCVYCSVSRFLRLTHNWLIPNTLHISLSLYCTVNWLANSKEREIAKLGLP